MRRSVLLVGALVAVAISATVQAAVAQSAAASRARAEATAEAAPESSRDELQRLYRELYELQLDLAQKSPEDDAVDSLRVRRRQLLRRIEAAARQLELEELAAQDEASGVPPRPPREEDPYGIASDLERLAGEVDWEEISRLIEENANDAGEGMAQLGELLKGIKVDISSDRVKIDAGSGSRFTFTIPEELREELSQGVREIGRELDTLLDDSLRTEFDREWKVILDELPEDLGTRVFGLRRERERRVIAESVFRTLQDFELADDEAVDGDVIVIGSDAYIAGEVRGAVVVLFGDLFVEDGAIVAGDAVSLGGRAEFDERVEVRGKRFDLAGLAPGLDASLIGASGGLGWLFYGVRLAILVALLLVAHALVGPRLEVLVDQARASAGRSLLSGAIWYAAAFGVFVVASVGLAISVIGIPVVLVLVVGFVVVTLLSYYAGCEVLGERLAAVTGGRASSTRWKTALLGIALLELPALAALLLSQNTATAAASSLLTGLEFFLRFVTISLGFGAIIATRMGGRPADDTRSGGASLPVAPEV